MESFGPSLAPLALLFSKGSSLAVENTPLRTLCSPAMAWSPGSLRSFREGPFGLGSGVIISSGNAVDAAPGGFANSNLGYPGSSYCGQGSTFDAAFYTVDFLLRPEFDGVQIEFVAGSADSTRESDPIAIWLNGDQYAIDSSGQQITATSEFLNEPIGIGRPQNGLQFGRASPLLLLGTPTRPGVNTLVFAACDLNDDALDTGLLFNIKGCVDCDTNIKINYVTSTVTVGAAEETGAPETIKAAGQARGTVIFTVQETAVTTTTEAAVTTTAEAPTTTTEAAVTTSEAAITTAEPTTFGTVETSAASSDVVTEDTTAQTTTTEAGPVTTAEVTEAITSSAVVTDDSAQTTMTEAESVTTSEATTTEPVTTSETTASDAAETTTAVAVDTTKATASDSATLDITTSSITESIATTSAEAANTQTSAIGTTDVVSSDETKTATLSTEVETVSQSINPGTTTESSPVQDTTSATGTDSHSSIETASASTSKATSEDSTGTSTESASQLSSAVTVSNSQTTGISTLSTSAKRTPTVDSSLTSAKTDASAPTSITETISEHIATPYPTVVNSHTKGYNVTKTEPATTVTTVVYTTVNPHKPDCLTTTEIAVTVGYTPCNCAHQTLPPVEMTTVVVPCQSCGPHGENSISLTVPAAACETGSKSGGKSPSHPKGDAHEGHSSDKSYPVPGPNEQPKPHSTYKQLIQTMSAGDHGETEDHSAYQKNGQPSALPHKDYPTSNDKYPIHPTQAHGNYSAVHTETPQQPGQHRPNGQGQEGFSKTYITQTFTVAAKTQGTNSTTLHTGVPSYEPNAPIVAAGGIKSSSGIWYLASIACGAVLLLAI
ncbi:hypothetical protein ACHAQK_003794 [Fusarium lateritium]